MTSFPPPGREPAPEGWGISERGAGPGPGPGLDPLSRVLVRIVAGLAALLILLVAIAITYDNGGEADLNPIAEAAEQTQSLSGARMDIDVTYTTRGGGVTVRAHGDGEINWRTGRERASLTLPIPDKPLTIQTVSDGDTVYIQTSKELEQLPPGKRWVGISPFQGHDASSTLAGGADADQLLKGLEACGAKIQDAGEETIDGVSTERYRGQIPLLGLVRKMRKDGQVASAQALENSLGKTADSIPVEVWIDDEGIVRRLREVPTLQTGGNDDLSMDIRIDFHDFGVEPDISVPPPDEVLDLTPLVRARLGAVGDEADHPAPSADAKVSKADFLARARAVCTDALQEVRELSTKARALEREWTRTVHREGMKGGTTLRAAQRLASGYYEPLANTLNRAISDLSKISPPPSLAGLYRRYLHVSWAQIETLRGEVRAFEVGEYKTTQDLAQRVEELGKTSGRIGKKLGITDCDK